MKLVCTKLVCNLLRKKSREVTVSLPGRFPSRRCFTLCVKMEVEPKNCEVVQMPPLLELQKVPGKGDREWEKSVFASFLADQKIAISWGEKREREKKKKKKKKRSVLGHPIARATSYCFCQTHFDNRPPKMPLKSAV